MGSGRGNHFARNRIHLPARIVSKPELVQAERPGNMKDRIIDFEKKKGYKVGGSSPVK